MAGRVVFSSLSVRDWPSGTDGRFAGVCRWGVCIGGARGRPQPALSYRESLQAAMQTLHWHSCTRPHWTERKDVAGLGINHHNHLRKVGQVSDSDPLVSAQTGGGSTTNRGKKTGDKKRHLQTERDLADVHHVEVLQDPQFFLHVCQFVDGHPLHPQTHGTSPSERKRCRSQTLPSSRYRRLKVHRGEPVGEKVDKGKVTQRLRRGTISGVSGGWQHRLHCKGNTPAIPRPSNPHTRVPLRSASSPLSSTKDPLTRSQTNCQKNEKLLKRTFSSLSLHYFFVSWRPSCERPSVLCAAGDLPSPSLSSPPISSPPSKKGHRLCGEWSTQLVHCVSCARPGALGAELTPAAAHHRPMVMNFEGIQRAVHRGHAPRPFKEKTNTATDA